MNRFIKPTYDEFFEKHFLEFCGMNGVMIVMPFDSSLDSTLVRSFFGLPLEKIRIILDELPIGISYYDTDLRYQFINRTYKSWFEVTDELLGHDIRERYSSIYGKNFSETEPNFQKALQGRTHTAERTLTVGGITREFRISYVPNLNAEGRVIGMIGLLQEMTERNRAKKALETTLNRERALLDTIPDPVFFKDNAGRYIAANPAVSSMTGLNLGDILGKTDFDLFPAEFASRLVRNDETVRKTKSTIRIEEEFVRSGNSVSWFETFKSPFLGVDGEVEGIIGIGRDITSSRKQRVQQEQALHHLKTLDRVSQIAAKTGDIEELVSKILETVFSVFEADRAWLMVSRSPDNLSWSIPFEFTRPEYPPGFPTDQVLTFEGPALAPFHDLLASSEPQIIFPLKHPVLSKYSPTHLLAIQSQIAIAVRPKAGPVWVLGLHRCRDAHIWTDSEQSLFREISYRLTDALTSLALLKDLKSSNAALRESETNFRALAENAQVGMLVVNEKGTIVYANQYAAGLLGEKSPEEIPGKVVADILQPKFAAIAMDRLERRLKGLSLDPSFEVELPRADGDVAFLEVSGTRTFWKGELVSLVVIHDITMKKHSDAQRLELLARTEEARLEAERANHAKDVFLATLSHELRSPLTSITTWAQLLNSGKLDPERTLKGIQAIERSAKAQAQLINDLLDVSRIIMGKLRVDVVTTDAVQIVNASVDSVETVLNDRRITIDTKFDGRVKKILADPVRVQQILWNLLHNAAKFSPEGGRISVEVRREGNMAAFSVQDWGKGIPASFLPRLFNRFSQADTSSTRSHGGLGLGLAIVRHLVELHGGSVSAHSSGPGMGATFSFTLPLSESASSLPGGGDETSILSSSSPEFALNGIRLLIVEDERSTQMALECLLQSFGANVDCASSCSEGLEKLARSNPHIVISDIGMPEEDGYVLLSKIRALASDLCAIPVIALTAFAGPEDQRRAREAGFCAHVAKPVDPDVLVAMIRTFAIRKDR